ncbi:hypothetical protein [Asanoa sp. NPDC050611]
MRTTSLGDLDLVVLAWLLAQGDAVRPTDGSRQLRIVCRPDPR